jgi:uncharacterized protein YggT (Ycf19 family)
MLTQIGTLLIDSLGSLFVYALLLRFHMQWLRAPFRNPIAILQAVLSFVAPHSPFAPLLDTLTRRFYAPFRRFIPPIGRVDISPLFLIITAQIVIIMLEWLRRVVATPF